MFRFVLLLCLIPSFALAQGRVRSNGDNSTLMGWEGPDGKFHWNPKYTGDRPSEKEMNDNIIRSWEGKPDTLPRSVKSYYDKLDGKSKSSLGINARAVRRQSSSSLPEKALRDEIDALKREITELKALIKKAKP